MNLSAESKRRYDAFWDNDVVDHVVTYLRVPDFNATLPGDIPRDPNADFLWGNLPYRVKQTIHKAQHTKYYLDGFSTEFVNFGPGALAACLGASFDFAKDTIWFGRNQPIKDWDTREEIRFDPDAPIWHLIMEYNDSLMRETDGYVSVTDLGGNLDILASLRGTENLLFDVIEHPEEVKKASDEIYKAFIQAYELQTKTIFEHYDGMTSWMDIWCRDRYYPLQCDFSAMISPEMFHEFVMPDLLRSTEYFDKSIYHLDGVGELPHLKQLLSLKRLNAIQWMTGAGKPDPADPVWFDLYDEIQAAGKGLVLFVNHPELIENLLKHISPKGVYISTVCKTEYDAEQLSEIIIHTKQEK